MTNLNVIPFNPLDKKNLGASVAEALLTSHVYALGDIPAFVGAGIYALYYTGKLPCYADNAKLNVDGQFGMPIYVGKAVPSGARKGGGAGTGTYSRALVNRLNEHADSIRAVSNLDIEDFWCRFLVVDDIWIPLGESLIIARFSPVWNSLIDGFGNHDPGKGRYNGMRPRWDVLHPGRLWATKCRPRGETAADISRDVKTYLRGVAVPRSTRFISADD
jgi:hypothetical protein